MRYAETDAMGIAHHASYVVWLELARVEWLKAAGADYRWLEREGVSLAVSKLELDYRSSLRFDDEITVSAQLTEAKSRRAAFAYSITAKDNRRVAEAVTWHVPVGKNGLATRMPEGWLERLRPLVTL